MAVAALGAGRLTLVSLTDDEPSASIARLLRVPAFRAVHRVPMRVDTPTQRKLTASRLDAVIGEADRAVLLMAEGAGCEAAAWWSRLSPRFYVSRVAGALMIAPRAGAAAFASPRSTLPFPSIVIGDDDTSQRLASEWGSRLIDGPLPAEQREPSGRFQAMIARFTSAIVERDVRTAERLIAAIGDR